MNNELYSENTTTARQELDEFIKTMEDQDVRQLLFELCEQCWTSENNGDMYWRDLLKFLPWVMRTTTTSDTTASDISPAWVVSIIDTMRKNVRPMSSAKVSPFIRILISVLSNNSTHSDSPFFAWIKRNRGGLELVGNDRYPRTIKKAAETGELPSFEVFKTKVKKDSDFSMTLVEFDTDELFVRNLIRDVHRVQCRSNSSYLIKKKNVANDFVASLGFTPTSLEDFNVDTFDHQVQYYADQATDGNTSSRFVALSQTYAYIIDNLPEEQKTFTIQTGITRELVTRLNFCRDWQLGYRPCIHIPTDPVPDTCLWMLLPNGDELRRASITPEPVNVDVSYPNQKLQSLMASWFWRECENVAIIRSISPILRELFDTFDVDENGNINVSNTGIVKWLGAMRETVKPETIRHRKAWARSIIEYGYKQGILDRDETVLLLLSSSEKSRRWEADESTAADINQLKLLASELEQRSSNSLLDELFYGIFVTVTLTPLRIRNVIDLKISDFISQPGNIHSVRVSTKTDGSGRREVQLPNNVYRLLMALVNQTDSVRENAPENLADYIFIYESKTQNRIQRIRAEMFNTALKTACSDIGVEPIGAREIRRRYETEVVLQGIEKNLSRLALRPLTGHSSLATTEKYYVREDVREYLEAMYGIEIGIPKVPGEVLPSDDEVVRGMSEDDAVEDGAGYCRNPECNVPGTLSCLMCKGFVTAPICISEMEEAINNIQLRLKDAANNIHERDHLLAVKKLYLGYLGIMYSKKAGEDSYGK